MYEDAWFNSFTSKPKQTAEKSKHRRRESLLKQPTEANQADVEAVEAIAESIENPGRPKSPPPATVARRAKSYSDFYDVVRAHIKKERRLQLEKEKLHKRSQGKLRNDLQFGEWYNGLSEELQDASHEDYQLYHDQLRLSEQHLDSLLDETTSTLDLLSSLSNSFKAVEVQTTAFRAQCEGLLADQRRITQLADDIGDNLQYYTYLEPITRRLNAPSASNFVRSKEYSEMLANLDSCLEYMQEHPGQREASTYKSRYRLLLTRALTLIRVHFTNTLREIAADVAKRIADRQLNETTMSALLYAKFRVGAAELKETGLEIQKRAVHSAGAEPGAEAEYQSLMNELYQSYSTTRGRLILPIIAKKMAEIAMAPSTSKDVVAFARSSIGFMRGICFDEYDLWKEWFATDGGLYDFLEAMCEPMYDYLRPRTIHENQLLKLCELCTLIHTRYMEEDDDDDEPIDLNRLDFPHLIHTALEDAQTRLVFLALNVLRDDIEYYKPKAEDLDYPARNRQSSVTAAKPNGPVLSGRRDRKTSNGPLTPLPKDPTIVEEDGLETRFNFEPALQDCYPTLRKAIWLLSRIYRLVNSTVFDDLAHQIVHQTTLSLHTASTQISSKASPTDAHLFLMKHLLLLKQQIVAFDIEFVTPEVSFDFSNVTSTFWELRERGGLFNPTNLMRLVGGGLMPRVVENMLDAKVELDGRLRTVINDFTNAFANRMTVAIAAPTISKQGPQFNGIAALKSLREQVEKDVPFLRKKLDEYLDDPRTKETLVGAVQDQILQCYDEFYVKEKVRKGVNGGGKAASTKGKGRDDEVWDADMFAEWAVGVFKVGRVGSREEEGEDEDEGSVSDVSRSGST
ncbi:Sec34-domain-containing protein [Aulographum hederae CBS 113979]|uniref:Conserved oligomeric Golgi complex subunit 3 n=1 Tax=Aulographum hederae CBS 113979 TaxID=1176131 RepID=A0A6G1GTL7_9PEZI|nr:Sec34-domain-containing protein [Aulographum hederae CBS 113979]